MRNFVKKQTGITLIALVVTIIVLIILAGVSIAMLVGDNGIITQAQRADELTTQAQQKEAIELAVASIQSQGTLELDKTKLEAALQSQLGDTSYTLTENGDGSFQLQIAERSYYIDSTGEVITEEDMIAIGSAEELKAFRDDVNSGNTYEGKYVYLTGDITLNINEEWKTIGIYLNENTSVLDDTNKPFKGIFDGKNYTIDGLKITSQEKGKGLFGLINNGTVKNIIIGENSDINAGISFGTIAGYVCNNGSVENCINKANLKAAGTNFGGIVGTNVKGSKVKNCGNIGNMEGTTMVGGIVGNNAGMVLYCFNEGIIQSNNSVGGICGVTTGNIKMSYNKGNIITQTTNAGGIVGAIEGEGDVVDSYNIGDITGTGSNIGGIIGLIADEKAKLLNSYNIGKITSNNNFGGGIVGVFLSGNIQNCYFLENVVNEGNGTNIEGIQKQSSEELKAIAEILGEAFKQDEDNINQGYPVLAWQ